MKQQAKEIKKDQLAVKEEVYESALSAPDYLRVQDGSVPAGTENIAREDMTLPRLGLCQTTSPQRARTDPKYIEHLEEGMFFNSITKEVYGAKVKIVPLLFYKARVLFGEQMGGPLRCQAQDALHGIGDPGGDCLKCSLSQFGSSEKRGSKAPACQSLYNYASLVVGSDARVHPEGLLVFSLKSTGLKVAKDWNSLIKLRRTAIFAGVYEISCAKQKNDLGQWYSPIVQNAGWVSEETLFSAKMAYEAVAAMNREGRLQHDVSDLGGSSDEVETS